MFNSFKRRPPQISIFHNPSSPPSLKALDLLRKAVSGPYPPSSPPSTPPLNFSLDVVEGPPTKDQLQIILSYMPSKATNPAMAFLSAASPSWAGKEMPQTLEGIVEAARKDGRAVKWPVVVDWENGKASVGSVEGVKEILEGVRKGRDGEGR